MLEQELLGVLLSMDAAGFRIPAQLSLSQQLTGALRESEHVRFVLRLHSQRWEQGDEQTSQWGLTHPKGCSGTQPHPEGDRDPRVGSITGTSTLQQQEFSFGIQSSLSNALTIFWVMQ